MPAISTSTEPAAYDNGNRTSDTPHGAAAGKEQQQ
jgi:hypothetical protein